MANGLYSGRDETPGHVTSVGVPITLDISSKPMNEHVNNAFILLEYSSQLIIDTFARKKWLTTIG
jgi:hypothetical protein